MASSNVQIGPVSVPLLALGALGGLAALYVIGRSARAPVREIPQGKEQVRALREIDRRLDRLSRERAKAQTRIEKARALVVKKKERAQISIRNSRSQSDENRQRNKVVTLEKREGYIDEIERRINSNQATPSEIRELMASGALRLAG
jgi:chromosome segregation ATPase